MEGANKNIQLWFLADHCSFLVFTPDSAHCHLSIEVRDPNPNPNRALFFGLGLGVRLETCLKTKWKIFIPLIPSKFSAWRSRAHFFWVSFYYMYKKVLAASILEYQVGGFDISGGVRYCPVRSWPAIVHSVHDFWCPLYLYSILRRLNKQPPTLPA